MKTKNVVKSRASQIAAKKNPWFNFLREFRAKNKGKREYEGADGQKRLMISAGGYFKELTDEQKNKYREYQDYEKKPVEVMEDTNPKKTTRAKK